MNCTLFDSKTDRGLALQEFGRWELSKSSGCQPRLLACIGFLVLVFLMFFWSICFSCSFYLQWQTNKLMTQVF